MEKRPLGRTGESLSVIGFGGILVTDATTEEAAARVGAALDAGINYFDVAPSYGNAEEMLGPALAPYRDGVFLACKTGKRDAAGARAELEQSLRNLRTDRFDLYQLHALTTMDDLDRAFAPGGAMEVFTEARDAGRVRFLGFSAHSAEVAVEALRRFPFDSVLFPFNWVTWNAAGFGPQVMEAAKAAGAGRLALKAMARGPIPDGTPKPWAKCWYAPVEDPAEATLALRWTLSQDVTAALPPGEWPLFEIALRAHAAGALRPLSPDESAHLEATARGETPLFRLAGAAAG
jgi:aryl-alcohol dehydrogenase-like predicted oxidoreductase